MKKILALVFSLAMAWVGTGCVSTVDGDMRAGVPFSNDTIESHYERPLQSVFAAAKEVLARNGTLQKEDLVGNAIVAKIDTRTIYVRLEELNPKVTRVRTQIRTRNGTGDIHLASEVDKQIALALVGRP